MIDLIARKRCEVFFALARLDPIPGPPGGNELVAVVPFTFTTGTLVLGAVPSGFRFTRAGILIDTPFDDPAATIQLGTSANPGLILSMGDIRPTVPGQYESDALVTIATPDVLLLSIHPAASTQGAGLLLYKALP